jgi:hypothetical protein
VSRWVRLDPFGPSDVGQYIDHRLMIARGGPAAEGAGQTRVIADQHQRHGVAGGVTFTPEAVDSVARLSRGLPRVINLLCDRALEAAYAQQVRTVDGLLIQTAAGELQLAPPPKAAAPSGPLGPLGQAPHVSPAELEPDMPLAATGQSTRRALIPVVAVSAAAVIAAIWIGGRTRALGPADQPAPQAAPAPDRETRAAAAPSSNAVSAPAPPRGSPTASSENGPARPAPVGNSTRTASEASVDGFEIVVASFHTNSRAAAVADDMTALGLPVRRRVSNGWQQVLAGPFASRAKAAEAQDRLDRAGFSGTQIVPVARAAEATSPQ